jgi:cobalt-zinc-cadmium efflux system membrane fusion protein
LSEESTPPTGAATLAARALSRPQQWRIVILAAVALAVMLLLITVARALLKEAPAAAPAAAPPGTFRATPQQLKTFTIEKVSTHLFVSEEVTEGKVGVNADRATPVVSPFSGRVVRLNAGLGDVVKRGAPLAEIESTEYVQAQNDLRIAAAQLHLAQQNETRKHALVEARGGSLQDWQQAQADLASAQTALNAVRDRLRIFGKSDADITRLTESPAIEPLVTLTSPIAGVVVDRQLGPGQFLQAGGSPVFTVADSGNVWLIANVRESDAALIKVGQSLEVHVLAYPQRVFRARLSYVAALIDPSTHRLAVRAVIDNADGALKAEMFATFRIRTSEANASLAIDQAAVVYEGQNAHVWVLQGDLLRYRAVRIGRLDEGWVEVTEGLKAGEQVVTRGALFIDQVAVPGPT